MLGKIACLALILWTTLAQAESGRKIPEALRNEAIELDKQCKGIEMTKLPHSENPYWQCQVKLGKLMKEIFDGNWMRRNSCKEGANWYGKVLICPVSTGWFSTTKLEVLLESFDEINMGLKQ